MLQLHQDTRVFQVLAADLVGAGGFNKSCEHENVDIAGPIQQWRGMLDKVPVPRDAGSAFIDDYDACLLSQDGRYLLAVVETIGDVYVAELYHGDPHLVWTTYQNQVARLRNIRGERYRRDLLETMQ